MKKLKFVYLSFITIVLLFLSFVFVPVKVFAVEETSEDWINHISQFDSGYARALVFHSSSQSYDKFTVLVVGEPSGEFDSIEFEYDVNDDLIYFEENLQLVIGDWSNDNFQFDFSEVVENTLGQTNFNRYLYWNFEEQYWQIDYYNSSDFPGYLEDEGFSTYRYQFSEPEGLIIIDFTYPSVIFEGFEIPIEIDLVSFPANVGAVTIQTINFHEQEFNVYVTEFYNDTVNFFVNPSYADDKIWFTVLQYTYKGTLKTKYLTTDMPVTVYSSELDYYKYLTTFLNERINNLNNQISELQDSLDLEYDRGYEEGYEVGYDEGYDVGYDEGILLNNPEAYQEGFRDGEKSKIAKNNEAFYNGIEKWLVPAIITVIALGGFVTIAVNKRREQ